MLMVLSLRRLIRVLGPAVMPSVALKVLLDPESVTYPPEL
jgi:hypothetical protein